MPIANRRGKEHERATAKALGGKRIGPTGRATADVEHPLWAIECKERATVPQWLKDAMAQAVAAARPEQVPLVVLHELATRYSGDFVILRRADFEALCGNLGMEKGR